MAKRNYPSKETLAKMSKKLEKVQGTFILPLKANALDKAKYGVCEKILTYMHDEGHSQRELAAIMDIAETRVSEVVHYRIEKFTLEKLIMYYEKLNPQLTVTIS